MPRYPGLISTVGLSEEPVIYSIRQMDAQYVAFVCTPDSERKTLGAIVAATGLHPAKWRKYPVADTPEHIGKLCVEFHNAFRWLTEECGLRPDKIAADPTAGRKWMSSGATMVAAFLGLPMHYVDAQYVGGKPDPASMKVVELGNAYDQTGFIEAERGRLFLNAFEFAAASKVFDRIRPSLSTEADLYAGLAELARVLDRWDRFEHYRDSLAPDFCTAFVRLQRYLHSLPVANPRFAGFVEEAQTLAAAVDSLHADTRPAAGFTVDVFENARRRVAQGRHDDACGRLYRTLESVSQYCLATEYGLDSAKPDYQRLSPAQQQAVRAALGDLPKAIDLAKGQRLLAALGHRLGKALLAPNGTLKFAGLLEDRDHSILAHGFEPIPVKRVEQFCERLEGLLSEALGEEFARWRDRLCVPELPPILG